MMEWSEISDPTGEFDFILDWSEISGQYTPEEIQKMVNETGVGGMVHTVNEHFWLITNRKPLNLVKNNGRKLVMQA